MYIDQFLPQYDVMARYETTVQASVMRAYTAARHLDMHESTIIRMLYRLRGMPAKGLTLDGMIDSGFVLLADDAGQEILLGLIGRFWTPSGYLEKVDAAGFAAFHQPGLAKAAFNIAFTPLSEASCRVTTETRVYCPDKTSRRRFRIYWMLISPFSGWIRKEWLRIIKARAEQWPRKKPESSEGC
ncbi:hypothetical protein [Desulfosarcina sp.]|uniref:hypothetical protein n=1 Tax=Desulfosarcina sp. TaxID=2027861 RepID=UPI0029AECFE1|nr:hypothetical protein [Desulfosarcina sp.]MDX2452342.1 hypothetical protein [Desulfosarcina sp.]MDX2490122.1 hypothetical protein [Desulfosarcina sp.]